VRLRAYDRIAQRETRRGGNSAHASEKVAIVKSSAFYFAVHS
jgi:hypothetical protein